MPKACFKLLWTSPAEFQAWWVVPRANAPHCLNFRASLNRSDSAIPKTIIGHFFPCVYRNHKNTINKLLAHTSKRSAPAHTVHSNIFSNYSSRDNRNEISKGQSAFCLFTFKSKGSHEIKDSRCLFAIREYGFDFLNLRGKNIGQMYTCILIINWVL